MPSSTTLSISSSPKKALPDEVAQQLARYELLKPFIKKQLLEKTLQNVDVSQEESQQLVQQFCQKNVIKDRKAFKELLQKQAVSEESMLWRLTLPLRIKRYSLEQFSSKAEQRFLERKEQLDRVTYNLLRLKDGYLAQELYMRIAEKEASFAELASEFSEGSEKNNGGHIGPVPLRQAHPQLSEALRTHAPGVLIAPFKVGEWWLVVQLNKYTPASFDRKTRDKMCTELFEAWIDEQVDEQLQQL